MTQRICACSCFATAADLLYTKKVSGLYLVRASCSVPSSVGSGQNSSPCQLLLPVGRLSCLLTQASPSRTDWLCWRRTLNYLMVWQSKFDAVGRPYCPAGWQGGCWSLVTMVHACRRQTSLGVRCEQAYGSSKALKLPAAGH